MKMYNNNNGKVETLPKTVLVNGANMYTSKLTEVQLNSAGHYNLVTEATPDRNYYTYTQTMQLVGNKCVSGFDTVERSIEDVQARMIKSVEDTANSKFEQTTAGYTAGEMSSWAELEADATAHQTAPLTAGMLFNEAAISGITVDELATKVLTNAAAFKQAKAYISGTRKKKIVEVQALTSIQECIDYEKFEYVENQEILDTEYNGTGEFHDVTLYKNKCINW